MKKRMIIMLIGVGILFGCIIIYKVVISIITSRMMAANQPISTVSTMKASSSIWQPTLSASGSTRAIRGVNVTTQLAGMVQTIYFTPGADINNGDILVQQNADNEIATLHSLQASAELARITYERDKQQFAIKAISKQVLDSDLQNLKNFEAQVKAQAATVEKKTIRAPFTGRLGINLVNPGQFLNPGDSVVTLQTLDPIYVDFFMPQQTLSQFKLHDAVTVHSDAFPNKTFPGKITTINPIVSVDTRNVQVEATIDNPTHELLPGMYATVTITAGKPAKHITLPQSALSFNPYGSLVYLVRESGKDSNGKPILIARQSFVITGETRGDQIAILSGLKEGETVVTSGQLKLKNGSRIVINNKVQPPNNPSPTLPNEY